MTKLTDRELATVLAALRYWQQDLVTHTTRGDDEPWSLYFEQHQPLDSDEIDYLCERLNLRSSRRCCRSYNSK